jgi:hypothetical protein
VDFFHRPVKNRKHNVSETGSGSVLRWRGGPMKELIWITWGRKQIQFSKRRVFYTLENRTMEKVQNPVILYSIGGIAAHTGKRDTTWSWMVSCTLRSIYPMGKNFRYSFDGKLCGPQDRSGRCGGETTLLPLPGIQSLLLDRSGTYDHWVISVM